MIFELDPLEIRVRTHGYGTPNTASRIQIRNTVKSSRVPNCFFSNLSVRSDQLIISRSSFVVENPRLEPGFLYSWQVPTGDSQTKERLQHTLQTEHPAPNMKFNCLLFFSYYFTSRGSDLESAKRTIGKYRYLSINKLESGSTQRCYKLSVK